MSTNDGHPTAAEAFRARLPYDTIPTNVPGVFATAPLPPGFDASTASAAELIRHGLLWRRPEVGEDSPARRAWERAFATPLSPAKHIVPVMAPIAGRTHPRRPAPTLNDTSSNWSGSVLTGDWSTVSGFWTVPTVSKPTEAKGPGGGWYSSSWIGIEGGVGTDLLQAGVEQAVDGSGHASYTAWYEWYTSYRRVTLGDQTPSSYALASTDWNGALFLAFRGEEDHLDVMFSVDHGNSFGHKLTSGELTSQGPALVLHSGGIVVAWAAKGKGTLSLAWVTLTGTTLALADKAVLPWASAKSPALASFAGALFIAWKDAEDRLNVACTTDLGKTVTVPLVSTETSPEAPTLTVHEGKLLIGWKGDGNDFLNVAQITVDGNTPMGLTGKVTLDTMKSPKSPALASMGTTLFLAWKGDGNDSLNVAQSTDGGSTFSGTFTSFERSPSAPTLAVHLGSKLLIGWRGENDHLDLGAVGIRNGVIVGWSPDPSYYVQSNIKNFKVQPGDTMFCSIMYALGNTAGQITFLNVTSGDYFSITLVPPPEAELTGTNIEWIMEAPWIGGQTVLPRFTTFSFTDAFGCSASQQLGNARDGVITDMLAANGELVTETTLASETVTISFIG